MRRYLLGLGSKTDLEGGAECQKPLEDDEPGAGWRGSVFEGGTGPPQETIGPPI